MQPRIFISAVSKELGEARQVTANVLTRFGFQPVWQNYFEIKQCDIKKMLYDLINSCEGVVHLVGFTYGIEQPVPDVEFGPLSYAQYEYVCASRLGKKSWIIIAEQGFEPDLPWDEETGLPPEGVRTGHPQIHHRDRRQLQSAWRERLRRETMLWYPVHNGTEIELTVERLKDELEQIRIKFECSRAEMAAGINRIQKHLDNLNSEKIRGELQKSIEQTYQKDIVATCEIEDWRRRDVARNDAGLARTKRLSQLDEFVYSIFIRIRSGDASTEFIELIHILQEQGVDEALAYITSQQLRLFTDHKKINQNTVSELRKTLSPLFYALKLNSQRGEYLMARIYGEELLKIEPAWPELLHHQFWVLTELGDRALKFDSDYAAESLFRSGFELAERNVNLRVPHAQAQRDLSVSFEKLGDVMRKMGDFPAAIKFYQEGLDICQKLSTWEPTNAQAQRDLASLCWKTGEAVRQTGDISAAAKFQKMGIAIQIELAAEENPTNPFVQRNLLISYNDRGLESQQSGDVPTALRFFQKGLEISQALAATYPEDVQAQRDLSVSYLNLGGLAVQAGDTENARRFYEKGLDINQELAAADPKNIEVQCELSDSYARLGDVMQEAGDMSATLRYYNLGLGVCQKLAVTYPDETAKQYSLSESYRRLGDLMYNVGDVPEAIKFYQLELEVYQKLAAADPTETLGIILGMAFTHHKLGEAHQSAQEYDKAIAAYLAGIEVLDASMERKQNVEVCEQIKEALKDNVVKCEKLSNSKRCVDGCH